jgi:Cu2+-exporting ATPase
MSKVERGLGGLPGVVSARVNLSTRVVSVEHDPALDAHDLVMALADLGYEAQARRDELAPRCPQRGPCSRRLRSPALRR